MSENNVKKALAISPTTKTIAEWEEAESLMLDMWFENIPNKEIRERLERKGFRYYNNQIGNKKRSLKNKYSAEKSKPKSDWVHFKKMQQLEDRKVFILRPPRVTKHLTTQENNSTSLEDEMSNLLIE